MNFSEINPYVRYARYMNMDSASHYMPHIPYDARVFYTYGGSGIITIGKNEYQMNPGNILIINSGIEYHLKTPEGFADYIVLNFDYTQDNRHVTVPVPPETKRFFKKDNIIESITFDDMPMLNRHTYIKDMSKTEKLFRLAVHEYSRKMILSDMRTSALTKEILIDCVRKLKSREFFGGKETTEHIIDYIHKNYLKQITNSEISKLFGFHPNYVSEIIKLATGMPLHKYILHVRLMNATDMLESGRYTISEIAAGSGFSDIYYFSKYFKKIMGMTPTEYKKRMR